MLIELNRKTENIIAKTGLIILLVGLFSTNGIYAEFHKETTGADWVKLSKVERMKWIDATIYQLEESSHGFSFSRSKEDYYKSIMDIVNSGGGSATLTELMIGQADGKGKDNKMLGNPYSY